MDNRGNGSVGEGTAGLSEVDPRTLWHMRIGSDLPVGVGLAATLVKDGDVSGCVRWGWKRTYERV